MVHLLPALHEGHAPIQLHLAFEDALDAFESWAPGQPEPEVLFEEKPVAISAIFGRMRRCSDLLPRRLLDHACDVSGAQNSHLDDQSATYAHAALLLRALCVERLKAEKIYA